MRLIAALVAAAAVALIALHAAPANAEETAPVTWSVTPADAEGPDGRAWVELELDPGQSVTDHLAVRNLGTADATFEIAAEDGYLTETGRFNMLPADAESVDAGTWVDVADRVTVAAGETAVIPFTVRVPGDAAPGDHAAGIAASIRSVGADEQGAALQVESRVGFRVMTRVTGPLIPDLEVADVHAVYRPNANPFVPGSASVSYTVRNTGNTRIELAPHVSAAGVGAVVDPSESALEVLPGDERVITAEIDSLWPTFLAPVTVEVAASVTTPPGVDASPEPFSERAETMMWAVPVAQLLTIAALGLLGAAVFAGRRRSRARLDALLADARREGARQAAEVEVAGG